jgi:exopolysaccharide biosynthesis polyprenyl glycosylphosphotransferase
MTTTQPISLVEPGQAVAAGETFSGTRRWEHRYVLLLLGLDSVVALCAAIVAYVARFGTGDGISGPYLQFSLAFPVVWIATAALVRAYEPRFLFVGAEEYRRILFTGMVLTAGVAIASYAAHLDVARGYVVIALPGVTLAEIAVRHCARMWVHHNRTMRGRLMRRVLVVGHESGIVDISRTLHRKRYHGMHVVGACLPVGRAPTALIEEADIRVYGDFSDVAQAVATANADTVAVLGCPEIDSKELRRLAWQLESTRVDLVVAPALMEVAGPRISIRPVDGLPLLHVEHPVFSGGRRLVKAIFDRVVAAIALVLLSPLLIGLAIAIRLDSEGPALFRQIRVGKDGQQFRLFKFRSMYIDAEARLADLQAANEKDSVLFKIRNDPRVTRLGQKLRRYSLDELPQLLNVFLGEMSLVGPRPALQREVDLYGDDVLRRLAVPPGMTGLWQVSGRSDLSWEESERLDLRYVENWSLALDVMILWRTVFAVLKSDGAY